ncbi:MAG TPA: cytochrome c oxidase subunit II [Candidatus Nanopelagicales bacterium]|nr:cytochrome c oxidase subunit II [Candidatus Nanopelagicales bacterium]
MASTEHLRPGTGPRRSRPFAVIASLVAAGVVLSGCTANEAFFFDLPEPASAEAPIMQNLWNGSWIAAWAVGIFTWALMIWAAVAYRRRHANEVPAQTRYNVPIEALYTVVPLIMILGLFWFTARDQSEILTVDNDQQQTVNVVGFQWSWGFNYLDEDVYDIGMPYGEGSVGEPPTLYLPVDEKIRFELTSPDVIHSFWVPAFLFKMDLIPGKTNVFELTPDRIGTYAGKCAELCGVDHARMLFQVKVVERAEFDDKMAELRAKGQTGQLDNDRTNTEGQRPEERRI